VNADELDQTFFRKIGEDVEKSVRNKYLLINNILVSQASGVAHEAPCQMHDCTAGEMSSWFLLDVRFSTLLLASLARYSAGMMITSGLLARLRPRASSCNSNVLQALYETLRLDSLNSDAA
jgi:hypothetical protein